MSEPKQGRLAWAIKWRSENRLDGKSEHLMWSKAIPPLVFATRDETRAEIRCQYGYIAQRPDLRREPHGWKMPVPVKVRVTVIET